MTLSDGLVSGRRRISGTDFVQTTAPVSSGSSGGGLFDEQGKLIGVTTFVLRKGQNLNFAIASDGVRQFLDRAALRVLVERHVEARGGRDALARVKTVTLEGRMKIGELTIPFSTEWKRPRLYRMDMWVANDRTTQAFDGREVWIRDTAGLRTGRDVNPEDRATIIDSAKHFLDQIRLDSRPVVELLGIESLADGKAYKIRLLEENKTERLIYLDTASFLDVRVVRRFLVDGREVQGTMEATAPVWRNGVLFFTRATVVLPTEGGNTEMVMEMETTEVQVNKEIPEQRFLSVKPLPSPSPRDTGTARPND